MIEIRELRAGDLPGVASLWDLVEHDHEGIERFLGQRREPAPVLGARSIGRRGSHVPIVLRSKQSSDFCT